MMTKTVPIILSLLALTLGNPDCTVALLQDGVELPDQNTFNKTRLTENQELFRKNCSDSCYNADVNGIMRRQCSQDIDGLAVYQCPNNDSLFYLMNPKNCRIKYYTLCNEAASYKDEDLIETLKDLLCSCGTQPKSLKHFIGNTSCTIRFNQTQFLFCKKDKNPYIQFSEACLFPICEDNLDVNKDRFNCDGQGKGVYCSKDGGPERFVVEALVCDGDQNCDDHLDEKGCDEDAGVYCDKDGAKVEYRKEDQVCDGFEHCLNGADESKDRCNDNYCEDHDGGSIFISKDILCDGITDCKNAKDEDEDKCKGEFLNFDGAPCDNDTKWIQQKYLCSANLCEDGMDMSERWNCSKHELCEDPNKSGRKVLCNSTVFCTAASDSATTVLHDNCALCENGAATSYKRCKDSGKGVTCKKEIEVEDGPFDTRIEIIDIFVPSGEVCDGVKHCMDGEDEQNCPYGYYCMNQKDKFVPWENVCPNGAQREAACDDKSDQDHCDSDFFDYFEFMDEEWNGDYSEYLNITRIFGEAANQIDKDTLRRVIKHRAFACQELFYDLEDRKGGKAAIIKEVIEKLCIDEEKFNCPRPYDDTHFANNGKLNRKIMKKWLCQYPDYCGTESGGLDSKPQIENCRSSLYCYTHGMRCNSVRDCDEQKIVEKRHANGTLISRNYETSEDNTDEIGCSDEGLKCGPKRKVIEDAYVCDGYNDCNETQVDEKICDGNNQDDDSKNPCTDSNRLYLLYSNYILDTSTNSYTFNETWIPIPDSCECKELTGDRYLAAVCNTEPNAADQPCIDSKEYNREICYPENHAEWYSKSFNDLDVDCKTQTKTLTTTRREGAGGVMKYRTFVRYHNESLEFADKSVFCKNPKKRKQKKCGIPLTKMCDLKNDCGDWSDEASTYCLNNFECRDDDNNVTRVIASSKKCNGASDCDMSQDECLDECNEYGITNTVSLLGGVGLLVVVWIFGVVSLIFNVYLIITMTKSAFDVLEKVPHRFIYRILVTTIAIGDVMVSLYLVMLASVDSFREKKYCEMKEDWLTGSACMTMGVLSTFGNHVSLFAMVTLSLFRLKTVVNYLWPRSVNRAKAIQITFVLVLVILIGAVLISTIPLVDSLKDSFVDRYYFPNRGNVFERGEKRHIHHTMDTYNREGGFYYENITNLKPDSKWDDLLEGAEFLFSSSIIITDKKPYSFYSAYGVCLFNYLNSTKNNSFPYVISIISLNLVCFLTIISSYLWIWKVGTKSKSTERQLQKKLSIAVFLNILCRLPLFMICLAHSIERFDETAVSESCQGTCLYYRYMSVFVIPINSVINPFINAEEGLLDMIRAKCFGKRKNMITNDKTIDNSVTMGTSLTTVSMANKNPTYKLSKVDPPTTLEEEDETTQ